MKKRGVRVVALEIASCLLIFVSPHFLLAQNGSDSAPTPRNFLKTAVIDTLRTPSFEMQRKGFTNLKSHFNSISENLRKDSTSMYNNAFKERLVKAEFDSSNPNSWKQSMSTDDLTLSSFRSPTHDQGFKEASNFSQSFSNGFNRPLTNANVHSPLEMIGSHNSKSVLAGKAEQRLNQEQRLSHYADSVQRMKALFHQKFLSDNLEDIKKIPSEKIRKKLYDSLRLTKADSLVKVASAFSKTEAPEEELVAQINQRMSGRTLAEEDISREFDKLPETGKDSLSSLSTLPKEAPDLQKLSELKLPDSLLSELPPLSGRQLDAGQLPVLDSLRRVKMKAQGIYQKEKSVSENLKQSVLEKKPSLKDKLYFEGIISFINDSTIRIAQFSPAIGFYLADNLSIGAGPNILVQIEERRVKALGGLRTFLKAEVFKQRAYLQLEDNINETQLNREVAKKTHHQVLAGGGVLLPISKSIAINACVLYKVNQQSHGGTPFVFRIGFSSVKDRSNRKSL